MVKLVEICPMFGSDFWKNPLKIWNRLASRVNRQEKSLRSRSRWRIFESNQAVIAKTTVLSLSVRHWMGVMNDGKVEGLDGSVLCAYMCIIDSCLTHPSIFHVDILQHRSCSKTYRVMITCVTWLRFNMRKASRWQSSFRPPWYMVLNSYLFHSHKHTLSLAASKRKKVLVHIGTRRDSKWTSVFRRISMNTRNWGDIGRISFSEPIVHITPSKTKQPSSNWQKLLRLERLLVAFGSVVFAVSHLYRSWAKGKWSFLQAKRRRDVVQGFFVCL